VVRAPDGLLTAALIRGALRPRSYYRSDLAAVVLENTHNLAGGAVADASLTRAAVEAAHQAGLTVHVDGARVWNAAVALGCPPRDLLEGADTAMVALSKGLCVPAGALLLSTRARIAEARRVRKQLGGGMRQVGILAAAGLVGLETMIPRLAEDHAHAALLADALRTCPGVEVPPARTNIVVGFLADGSAPDLVDALAARGVLASAMDGRTLRLVTHRDVSRADCEAAARAVTGLLG
jgi:threonine aldolase